MIIAISAWYNEPEIAFNISYKVHNLIWNYLTDLIMIPFGLQEKDSDFLLRLVTATSKGTTDLVVKGPELNKRAKSINFGWWLPYEKIHNSGVDYLHTYLQYYFDGLIIVFQNFGVQRESLLLVKNKVEQDVLNNKMYAYGA